MVDSAITILNQEPKGGGLGAALSKLTESIVRSDGVDAKTKSELLQILAVVAAEATLPENDRRPAAVKPLLLRIGEYLAGAKARFDLWSVTKPFLAGHFGIPDVEV